MAQPHGEAAFDDAVLDPARNDQVSPGETGAVMMPQRTNEQLKRRIVRACEDSRLLRSSVGRDRRTGLPD